MKQQGRGKARLVKLFDGGEGDATTNALVNAVRKGGTKNPMHIGNESIGVKWDGVRGPAKMVKQNGFRLLSLTAKTNDAAEKGDAKTNDATNDATEKGDAKTNDAMVDAAKKGNAKIVQELLVAGADVDHTKKGDKGRTALYWAAMNRLLDAAQALIDAGADVDKGGTDDGTTPLIWAVMNDHLEVVKALVGAKAKVNKASNRGTTPLKFAITNKHTTVIEYLKSVGAR